jgi:spermidine/putrescine transport system substrate-binding protein
MKKILSCLAISAAALGLGLTAPAARAADQPTLNLFIWSQYIDPNLLKDFEKQCNCKVVETDYESNAEMEAKLKTGGDSQYDVVVPSSYYVPEMTDEGLLQKIDHSKLSNFSNLDPKFQNPSYDPNDAYSIPYQWGTTGIVFDPAKIKTPGDSWAILFDPKANPNFPFELPKGEGRDQIGAACAYLGYGFNCSEKSQWLAAAKLIVETKKRANFAGFEDETPALDKMKSGLIAVSMSYNGDVASCYSDGSCTKLKYFLPKDGSEIWVDTMAIPTHAPHPALALQFINFILDATNGATLSNFNQYASPNAASQKQLSGILSSSLIVPTPEEMKNLSFLAPLRGAQYKLFNQIWTSVLQ